MNKAALTNQRALLAAYNRGELERVATDLNRYFPIVADNSWTMRSGCYAGEWRRKTYHVKHSKGVARWRIELHNGSLSSVECTYQIKEV